MKKIIAIDIGNTETTVGIGNIDGWDSYRFTTRDANTPDELLALFNSTFNLIDDKRKDLEGSMSGFSLYEQEEPKIKKKIITYFFMSI